MPRDSSKFCGVIGTAYCGSTMFSYILGSSPDIFATGELILGFERYRCSNVWHGGDWTSPNLSPAEKKMSSVKITPCPLWTEDFAILLEEAGVENRNMLLKERAREILGKSIVLNPDKAPKWYKKSISAGDDLDHLIVLFKRPEAYAFSFEVHKREQGGKWAGKSRMDRISAACEIYEKFYRQAFEIIENHGIPAIFLNYEDFANDPYNKTEIVCELLGARYDDDMISYWDNRDRLHMTPSGNRGAHIQFLEKDSYAEYWGERLTPNSRDSSYFEEHANWFLKNYHKITIDEKWRDYLNDEERGFITNNGKVMEIFSRMCGLGV